MSGPSLRILLPQACHQVIEVVGPLSLVLPDVRRQTIRILPVMRLESLS
jgi:hypothetical protein